MGSTFPGQNREYAFITCGKEAAQEAVKLVCDNNKYPLSSKSYLRKLPQVKMFAVNIVLFYLVFALDVFILSKLVCDLCSIFSDYKSKKNENIQGIMC